MTSPHHGLPIVSSGTAGDTLVTLEALAQKVSRVHGDHNPKLRELEAAVLALIPAARERLTPTAGVRPDVERITPLLARVREAADDFALPEWACNSYRRLFQGLEELERSLQA